MIDKDNNLQLLLQKKETPELNESFENRMMDQIHLIKSTKSLKNKYIRLMYMFFALGLILGLYISSSLVNKIVSIGELNFTFNQLFFQIPFIMIFLFIFDKIYKSILFLKGKREIFEI